MAADVEPVSRTYVSQGLNLHYLDWGNEGAPLLLLVHGVRDHARSWDWTARALREQWHVVVPDLRGHGDSAWSPDGAYLNPYHVLDLANLTDTLGQAQLTIVAHSFGGGVAARYTAMFPERVRKLVLIEGLGPSDKVVAGWAATGAVRRTLNWIEKQKERAAGHPRRFATVEEAIPRLIAANKLLSPDRARHLAVHGLRRHPDGYSWKYDPIVGSYLPEEYAVDRPEFWRAITAPTLLCWGTESWTTNPQTDGRAQHFRDHRIVVFENAGHWIHHDRFDAVIATLREFL